MRNVLVYSLSLPTHPYPHQETKSDHRPERTGEERTNLGFLIQLILWEHQFRQGSLR